MAIVKKYWQLLFIIVAVILYFRIQLNPDLGTSLALGRIIVNSGTVPTTDPFSFSVPNYPYVHFWLSGVVLYLAYLLFGYWGTTFVYSLTVAVGLWLLAKFSLTKLRRGWWVVLLLFSIPLLSVLVGYRVQAFTFSGLAFLYYLFSLPAEKRRKKLLLVPLLFTVWANLHGGFILGVAFLGFLLIGEYWRGNLASFWPLPTAVLATLLNPNGSGVYRQTIGRATDPLILQQAGDWVSLFQLNYPSPYPFLQALAVAVGVFALLLSTVFSSCSTQKEKILALVFFGLTAYSRRYSLAFLVVTLPAFIPAAESWIERVASRQGVLLRNLLVSALLLGVLSNGLQLWRRKEFYNSEERYATLAAPFFSLPYGAVRYLQQEGYPSRLFNYIAWGAYLEWQFPEERIFIDGRMDNFYVDNHSFILDYWRVVRLEPGWQEILDKYQINAVLGPPAWPVWQILRADPQWKVRYRDKFSVLMRKVAAELDSGG